MGTSKAIRADDVSGLNIGTVQITENDGAGNLTKDLQRVVINNSSDGTMAGVGSAGLKVDASGATVPVSLSGTTAVRPTDGTNAISKTFDLDSSGTTHEWNLGVGLRKKASGGTVEAGTSSDPLRTDPTGTTTQPVSGTVTANITPATSGGCSIYHAVSAASNNAASIKGSAGQIFGWSIFNLAGYPIYVKFFAKASSPTPGTDTVVKTIGVQSGTRAEAMFDVGIAVGTGIAIAIVKGIADSDNTSIAASDCVVDIFYK